MVDGICISNAIADRLRLVTGKDDGLVTPGGDEVVTIVGAVGVDG